VNNRVGLVLTGLARDFEQASNNIYKSIIDKYAIQPQDIYINIWSDRGYWYPGDARVARSFMESSEISVADIQNIYPKSKIEIENFNDVKSEFTKRIAKIPEVFIPSISHSNFLVRGINLFSMFYKIQKGLTDALSNKQITHIVRTRPDIVIHSRSPRMSNRYLTILKQANHLGQGIGDNFHIGPTEFHKPIAGIFNNIEEIFKITGGLVCPHLFVEATLDLNSIPYKQRRLKFETLHTPGGMYKALNLDGTWGDLQTSDYVKNLNSFRGGNL
jgi:hypothetical protein